VGTTLGETAAVAQALGLRDAINLDGAARRRWSPRAVAPSGPWVTR
jgi:hypothetical protein